MPDIVTLAEAKEWLRYAPEETHEDATLAILIAAATEAALTTADALDGSDPVPARLKLAVLTHVARAFQDREEGSAAPEGNSRLLMPLRTLDV